MGFLLAVIFIPLRCVEPMQRFYDERNLWSMESPYNNLLESGQLDVGGCTIGLNETADVVVPKETLLSVGAIIRQSQNAAQIDAWKQEFLTQGCVTISDAMICQGD